MKNGIYYMGLVVAVLAMSTSAIFVKVAGAPAAVTAFYRMGFALLALLPTILLRPDGRAELRSLTAKQLGMSLLSGVLLAVHYILWFESLNYTSVASSTVLVTLQPLFTIALSYCILKQRQTKLGLLGCAIAVAGSVIIGWGDFQSGVNALLGDVLALTAAGLIALHFFIGQFARKNTSAAVYSALGYLGGVVFLGGYGALNGLAFTGYSTQTWLCFVGVAMIATMMGQFIFNLLLKWLPATAVSMSILGEPVGTCILAYFILSERISLQQGIGMIIIMAGLSLYFLTPKATD